MQTGKFVTIEGIEGVGKSSNAEYVRSMIDEQGYSCYVTREPGGTLYAEKIREILLTPSDEKVDEVTELLLMFAARAQHIGQVIRPKISHGHWVLCDRFTDATYAYQGGGRGENPQRIKVLEELVQGGLEPDLTILLDAPVKVGLARARKRSAPDRFEREKEAFFERVRQCYLDRAAKYPERIKVIDASVSLPLVQKQLHSVMLEFFSC